MRYMENGSLFTHTESELFGILEELRRYEPIFHTPEFGASAADYERRLGPKYWEVGASGRRYSREFVLRSPSGKRPVFAASVGWQTSDHALRRLGPDTYLMTYVLRQAERLTRRATVWQNAPEGWSILYHQGTVVSAEEDDTAPS